MADTKISAFPAAAALSGPEILAGVQSAANVGVTAAQMKTFVSASPTLVTPALGTPASGVLTNCTGLPTAGLVNSAVTLAKIANAGANSVLVGAGSAGTGAAYSEITLGSGLTMTGTVLSSSGGGGTPAGASLTIQYNNAGSFGGMSGTAWDDTNRSLVITGATVTASKPVFDISQTFNNGAVNFTGFKANFTNTASAGYLMFDWQLAGASKLSFDGTTLLCATSIKAGTNLQAATAIWGNTNSSTFNLGASADVQFDRIAAGIIKLSDGGSGAGAIRLNPVAVASLPSAATAGNGARAHVTDASGPTFGATVTGGGAVSCPVYSDGSNWKVG